MVEKKNIQCERVVIMRRKLLSAIILMLISLQLCITAVCGAEQERWLNGATMVVEDKGGNEKQVCSLIGSNGENQVFYISAVAYDNFGNQIELSDVEWEWKLVSYDAASKTFGSDAVLRQGVALSDTRGKTGKCTAELSVSADAAGGSFGVKIIFSRADDSSLSGYSHYASTHKPIWIQATDSVAVPDSFTFDGNMSLNVPTYEDGRSRFYYNSFCYDQYGCQVFLPADWTMTNSDGEDVFGDPDSGIKRCTDGFWDGCFVIDITSEVKSGNYIITATDCASGVKTSKVVRINKAEGYVWGVSMQCTQEEYNREDGCWNVLSSTESSKSLTITATALNQYNEPFKSDFEFLWGLTDSVDNVDGVDFKSELNGVSIARDLNDASVAVLTIPQETETELWIYAGVKTDCGFIGYPYLMKISSAMDGETEKGIVYCIENGEVGIAGYGGLGDEPAIPESIDGYPVTSILNSAFANCDIKSINIPKNIRNVGDNAFEGCSALENVYYNGTYADWESINKGNGNECLENAVWHYKIPSSGVSFYAASADSAAGSVLIEGDYDVVSSVETGSEITIRAIPSEGYRFSYWKNRSGKVLSTDAEETFRINTNTAIFAEFSKITAADDECVNVSFYNENGFSLGKRIAEKGESFGNVRKDIGIPELTGYKFLHWSIYSDKSPLADETPMNSDLDAVAIFGDTGQLYTVKVNGANYGTSFKYGEKVSVTSTDEKFRCWKIGDKVLSYRRTYEFFVWGDISISSDIYGEERPVAMLVSVEETPMLIYDVPQGFEIVEAGILFGSNKRIHIASLDGSKATARQMTGQFTAQPHTGASEATVARGYLIYKTPEKEIRVIYAD